MSAGWGPQPTGGVYVQNTGPGGGYWVVFAIVAPFISIFVAFADIAADGSARTNLFVFTGVVGALLGLRDGRKEYRFALGHWISAVVILVCIFPAMIAYAAGYVLGAVTKGSSLRGTFKSSKNTAPASDWNRVLHAENPHRELMVVAANNEFGKIGGHAGWTEAGQLVSANPRSAMLVIGPPGSGKTAAYINPSVVLAPGACVASTVKPDVMQATAAIRSVVGRVWHFDPGGAEQTMQGVIPARWSPLVGITTWEDAREMANQLADPAMNTGGGKDDNHFAERARDWIEVLLFAAHLGNLSISTVADWAQNPDSEDVEIAVNELLMEAESAGDESARIALGQHRGLLATPDRERGSIKSTMVKLLRIYYSMEARRIGENPNFDPAAFVRSSDTLYITAPSNRQKEYAPLLVGLLQAIRFATYARDEAEKAEREPTRPHVTFVLDEANNTAPIPLPQIVSEAGGQSLHLIVGIQDLSRARSRWGQEADGFLTLFPTKVVLHGVIEPFTTQALSNAAGEYDRVMMGYSESTSYIGPYNMPVRHQNPNYSVQRQKVLTEGDISNIPPGKALLFVGAVWWLVDTRMHWQDPVWNRVLNWPEQHYKQIHQQAAHAAATNPAVIEGEPA